MKNTTPETTRHLTQAVHDAQLLIAYAAQSGLTIEPATLKVLVDAQHRTDRTTWSNEQETDFWQAFNTLTQLIKPVTIESVQAVAFVDKASMSSRWLKPFTRAYRTVFFYIGVALLTMAILLAAQMYWLVGVKLSQNVSTLTDQLDQLTKLEGYATKVYQEEETSLRLQLETNRETMLLWSNAWHWIWWLHENTPASGAENYADELQKLHQSLKTTVAKREAVRDVALEIEETNVELETLYQHDVDAKTQQLFDVRRQANRAEHNTKQAKIELEAEYVLQVLQRYLLPVLYGLLGAAAYVLRTLIHDIRTATYTRKSDLKYGVRMFLGALTGPVIGFFILPESMASEGMLSPMAISFLAGYNIEILFSTMDRLVKSVSEKKAAVPKQAAAPTQTEG